MGMYREWQTYRVLKDACLGGGLLFNAVWPAARAAAAPTGWTAGADAVGVAVPDSPWAAFPAFSGWLLLATGLALGVALAAGFLHRRNAIRRQADAELRARYEHLDHMMQNMSQGLCLFGADGTLVASNEPYARIYGLSSEITAAGAKHVEILEARTRQGTYVGDDPRAYIRERLSAARKRTASRSVHELRSGKVIAITHQPLPDGGWLETHDDMTEIRRHEGQVSHMALHDALTDLPNRLLLRQRIDEALPTALNGRPLAVHCLDLDRFKTVNDTLGHPAGDTLLKAVADRLKVCVRDDDTVARLGGDEFAIIQVGVRKPDVAVSLAQRIGKELQAPFDLDGHQVVIDVSVGIAMAPANGTSADDLLKNADLALYRAKGDGRGVFRFFERGMDTQLRERRVLEMALRAAVAEGQFALHYQPIFSTANSAITGFEALLRWNHPERGLVPPADFLPLAEETGLMVPLGEWVLRTACAEAASWPGNLRVAVNLSATQFQSLNLAPTVVSALSASGLEARRLELEITESALLNETEATLRTLHMLRGLGVRIAMDDFGTGYSSLSYLRHFPFDKVKIDGSFVRDLGEAGESLAIVRAITGLGASLGMETTAEGVETDAQLGRIRAEGCSEVQGYFFSPPSPAEDLAARFFAQERQVCTPEDAPDSVPELIPVRRKSL